MRRFRAVISFISNLIRAWVTRSSIKGLLQALNSTIASLRPVCSCILHCSVVMSVSVFTKIQIPAVELEHLMHYAESAVSAAKLREHSVSGERKS